MEPVAVGPTWERDPDHPSSWHLPELTLGWAIVAWQARHLQHADGKPWRYTPEQLRFVLWWYALDPSGRRFLYRDGVLQRLKGWGKDPLGATICATEFVGPCRPDPAGREVRDPWGGTHPAGVPHPEPWVQTAAVSKDQTRNTMVLFPGLFTAEAVEQYRIDLGKEIIYAHRGRARIEAVTSSPRALEGARATFVLRNETHHWLRNNEGHEMDAVIERNATKSPDGMARALSITNAPEPGEDSVAERARLAHEAVAAGRHLDTGQLYDSLEAPPEAQLTAEAAPEVVRAVRGDSTWLDVDRIVAAILDPRNPPSRSRRYWYNQLVAAEDAWVSPQDWDACADPLPILTDGAPIALGFDGSRTDDHSALMACMIEDDHLVTLGLWRPDPSTGEVDRADIDRTVRATFDRYEVVGFYSDLHPWESYVDAWALDFGAGLSVHSSSAHAVAFDMRTRTAAFTVGAERLQAAILDSATEAREAAAAGRESRPRFTHDGHAGAREHFHNAKRAPNRWGVSIRKEHRESDRKVDAVAASILARMARQDYLALPEAKRRRRRARTGNVW